MNLLKFRGHIKTLSITELVYLLENGEHLFEDYLESIQYLPSEWIEDIQEILKDEIQQRVNGLFA